MSATDYPTTVDERIWALLEAHAPFTSEFKANNRIKLTGDKKDPIKTNWNDGDFPECTVIVSAFTDTWFTIEENYTYRTGFNPLTSPWTTDMPLTASIAVVHPDVRYPQASARIMEILTALRKGGPRLGITAFQVQRVGPVEVRHSFATSRSAEVGGDPGGTRRLVTNIRMPILLRLKGSQLVT